MKIKYEFGVTYLQQLIKERNLAFNLNPEVEVGVCVWGGGGGGSATHTKLWPDFLQTHTHTPLLFKQLLDLPLVTLLI